MLPYPAPECGMWILECEVCHFLQLVLQQQEEKMIQIKLILCVDVNLIKWNNFNEISQTLSTGSVRSIKGNQKKRANPLVNASVGAGNSLLLLSY